MLMKNCYQCKSPKDYSQFSSCQLKRNSSLCRDCNNLNIKKYRDKNKDKIKKYSFDYYQINKEKILAYKKLYYQNNNQKILENRKTYYKTNFHKIKAYHTLYFKHNRKNLLIKSKHYYINNNNKIKKYQNEYLKKRKTYDLKFRLKCAISANINFYLRHNGYSKNNKSTLKYLPYSIQDLKNHLEKQFEPWMNWANYGKYNIKSWNDNDPSTWTWQIDHIIPHSTFKYKSIQDIQFIECWSLNNLRPLNSKQNFIEGINRSRHFT